MTMQTPIEPSGPWTAPTPDAAAAQWAAPPPPPAKRRWPVWAWLLVALAVLAAVGAVIAAVVVAGGEDTAVVNTHTAEAGEPALISVPGYAYEDLAGDDLAGYQADIVPAYTTGNEELGEMYPELGDVYLGWSGHTVVAADDEVAVLVLASVNQDYLDEGIFTEEDVVVAMAGGAAGEGATVTTVTIAGEQVAYAEAEGAYMYFWLHDGVETGAFGPDEGDTRSFVEDYLEIANK